VVELGDVAGPLRSLGDDPPDLDELRRLTGLRRRRRLTGAAALVLALGIGVLLVTPPADDPTPLGAASDSSPCPPAPLPAPTVATSSAGLPHLAPPVPPDAAVSVDVGEPPVAERLGLYRQTFRCGDEVRRVSIETAPAGASFGLGVGTVLERGSRRYTLITAPMIASAYLTWGAPDGRKVLVLAADVPTEDVLRVVDGLRPRPDGRPGWDVGYLPAGLGTTVEGHPYGAMDGASRTISYETAADGRVTFSLSAAQPVGFDDLVADRLGASGSVEAVRVGDRAGYLFTGPGAPSRLLWEPRAGVSAELTADIDGPGLERLAASVAERPPAEWARFSPGR
jgi:hypothetical protein